MRFQCEDEVRHPVSEVFALLRDDMPSLLPYLDDVDEIRVLEREERGEAVYILNEWRGSPAKAPQVVQKFLSPDVLSWKDHADWYESGPPRAEWRLEPKVGGSLFTCSGKTSLIEQDGGTLIRIEGTMAVYPERLPGVPRILAARFRGRVESFIVGMIVPNMQTMSRGVQAYFDDQKGDDA